MFNSQTDYIVKLRNNSEFSKQFINYFENFLIENQRFIAVDNQLFRKEHFI
jgi:hypothetical protein